MENKNPNDNIYTFGSCVSTMRDKDHKRTPVQSWNGKIYMAGKKCIPMLDSSWKSTTPEKELLIWDHEAEDYCDVLTTGDYLVCYYGGSIEVAEVNNGAKGSNNEENYQYINIPQDERKMGTIPGVKERC